ncbi:MAG: ATP-binding protein [Bacteroidetes bacterium]|nr:MAG: ATP-binding protein [Bacteroidota bacterium]
MTLHELHIPSSRKNIHRVEEFFRTVNESYGLPDEKLHALLVAVTEAVNNGIIHGNRNDETKMVTVTCGRKGERLTVTVRDEGSGFDPSSVTDPLEEDNLLRTGGRGVFLMKAFMESVSYNAEGNEVTLVMKV